MLIIFDVTHSALTYITKFTSIRARPVYNALLGICWGMGSILGPLIGGGFANTATWRWAFYINLPLAVIMLPIHIFFLPLHNPAPSMTIATKLAKRVDWLGAILNAVVFATFMVVLTLGGATSPWDSAAPVAIWIVFGLSLLAYIVQQRFSIGTSPESRLFPVHFLGSRTIVLLFTGTAASVSSLVIPVYYLPVFFQFTKGDIAMEAAVFYLPIIGRYNIFYITASDFYIIGAILMHRVNVDTSTSAIYGFSVLVAVGVGMTLQTGYDIASAQVDAAEEEENAIGFINVAQIGCAAIALSVAGTIFQNVGYSNLKNALSGYDLSESEFRSALGGLQSIALTSEDDTFKEKALEAVVKTIGTVWILVIIAGAVSFISGVLMKREKLKLSGLDLKALV